MSTSTKLSFILALILLFATLCYGSNDVNEAKKDSQIYKSSSTLEGGAKGDAWAININNIYLPYNRKGIIADVNYPPFGSLGKYPTGNGKGFLFASGFMMSGMAGEEAWANGVASASLVEDYLPGTVADGADDSRAQIYVVQSADQPFGNSWYDWSDAVELGADFYDGDFDGVYNPIDKNSNGGWDPDEDRPDLIGDELGWTVYSDGVEADTRRWNTVGPLGIEVRQSIFSFATAGDAGNIIFVRYRIKYVGLGSPDEPDELTDVYFGAWADSDLGQYDDDLVGVDVPRDAGYTYNDPNSTDAEWGANPPCFMIDFLSGPVVYLPGETFHDVNSDSIFTEGIDIPFDTAYSIRGQFQGIIEYPGAKNLGLSSFVHYQKSNPTLGDPNNKEEVRYYMLGKDNTGTIPDPCNWELGEVLGSDDCEFIDSDFWYSGDPVTEQGWVNIYPTDQRQMQNTGPFDLVKGEQKEIMVAYIIGQGSDALSSITEARKIDDLAQWIFDNNFDQTTSVEDQPDELEKSVKLYQNYPNPFNPSTTIKYEIAKSADVQIKVFDVLGNEIATLVDGEKPAGAHEVVFSAADLSNGIYFYELKSDGFRDVKKLMLLK